MTIMAGVYSRLNSEKPSPRICAELKKLLSRHQGDQVVELANDRVWIAKVDIGAFASSGVYTDREGNFSVLTGEPILGDGAGDRGSDLKRLHSDWVKGNWSSTARTRGAFCAACYSPENQQLRLVTDRLGLRGLFFIICDRFVLFTTAFRIIERLACIRKTLDVAAVAELYTFGFPLGDSTDFLEVKRLLAAEVVVIDADHVQRRCYWSWDSIKPSTDDGVVERLYQSFMKAISLRLKADRTAMAFLSGGLDSRSIVAGLARQEVTLHTLNMSRRQTQDQVLGRQFAEALGTHHIEYDVDGASEEDRWKLVVNGMTALRRSTGTAPEQPGLIWGGEGGSYVLGHNFLTQTIVDLARSGDRAALFEELTVSNRWYPQWQRLLRRGWSEQVRVQVEHRFRSEMCHTAPDDPGRAPYFFLLLNEQRRHLDDLQANADLIRAEVLTPFFDIEFLCDIAATKIDLFLRHKLYVEWLQLFQPQVYSVPWQAYPGHVPCPLPVPADLEWQWEPTNRVTPHTRKLCHRMLGKTLRSSMVPGWLIRREVVVAAASLTLLGFSNYGYLLSCADYFATAWANCRPAGA